MYKEKIVSKLYDSLCTGCKFKASTGGCIKYSLSIKDINEGHWIERNQGGSGRVGQIKCKDEE